VTPQAQTVVVLGDSISAGYGVELSKSWVSLLEQRAQEKYPGTRIINAGISGDTTAGGLSRIDRLLQRHEPGILLLELGGNDALRGQSLKQLKNNLAEIIRRAQAQQLRVLLIGMKIPPNYGRRYVETFEAIYPALATEYDLPLVPFILEGAAGSTEYMQADGIHPNTQAQPILLDNVWPALDTLLKDTAVQQTGQEG